MQPTQQQNSTIDESHSFFDDQSHDDQTNSHNQRHNSPTSINVLNKFADHVEEDEEDDWGGDFDDDDDDFKNLTNEDEIQNQFQTPPLPPTFPTPPPPLPPPPSSLPPIDKTSPVIPSTSTLNTDNELFVKFSNQKNVQLQIEIPQSPNLISSSISRSLDDPVSTLNLGRDRDTLNLAEYDESSLIRNQESDDDEFSQADDSVNVIGMYADPAAEKDDWGDDFDLENYQDEDLDDVFDEAINLNDININIDIDEDNSKNKNLIVGGINPPMSMKSSIFADESVALAKAAALINEDEEFEEAFNENDENYNNNNSTKNIFSLNNQDFPNSLRQQKQQQQISSVSLLNIPVPLAEVFSVADDLLPLRSLPTGSFITPKISLSSLLMYPSTGYQSSALHPCCVKVKELFSTYGEKINKHFDAFVRDSKGTIAFDKSCKNSYLLYGDSDVSSLPDQRKNMSVDIIEWKIEWAKINNDSIEHCRLLISLSKIYKDSGNLNHALFVIKEALKILSNDFHQNQCKAIAIATELEYENAIVHRAMNAPAEAGRSLMRAMTHSATLAQYNPNDIDNSNDNSRETIDLNDDDLNDELGMNSRLAASAQRGAWWKLKCKYLRAELAYDLNELDTAVEFYSEYIVESISRMIGLIGPPPYDDKGIMIGPEYMRYCLFSPRRLVLALWTTVLCLGNMRNFGAAADVANLTSTVASAFAYEDLNEAASSVRSKIKVISAELKSQKNNIQLKRQNETNGGGNDSNNVSVVDNNSCNDFGVGDFGDVGGDDIVEDWDAQLEKELNITIQRCNDVDDETQNSNRDLFDNSLDMNNGFATMENESSMVFDNDIFNSVNNHDLSFADRSVSSRQWLSRPLDNFGSNRNSDARKPSSGTQEGNLIEAELRQYLNLMTGSGTSVPSRLMYPKPTEPYTGSLRGPKEHEYFLHTFVRSKDPNWLNRNNRGFYSLSNPWQPSSDCKVGFNVDISNAKDKNLEMEVLSLDWAMHSLDLVWKVVRSDADVNLKRTGVRKIIWRTFRKIEKRAAKTRSGTSGIGASNNSRGRKERLEVLGALLDSLRLAREVVSESGREAIWFSCACEILSGVAATLTPAAKAAVELFQVESRAHCGVQAVIPANFIRACVGEPTDTSESQTSRKENLISATTSKEEDAKLSSKIIKRSRWMTKKKDQKTAEIGGTKRKEKSNPHNSKELLEDLKRKQRRERRREKREKLELETDRLTNLMETLRLPVIDLMHSLYWQTKAGFDRETSLDPNSLELLIHAEVASSIFLIGSGISPVDGSTIDLSKEIRTLKIRRKRKTQSVDSEMFVDETRRVDAAELVSDLEFLWKSLPPSAGAVRAKISFALAHHAKVSEKNYSRAERLLFESLVCLHSVSSEQAFPSRFFTPLMNVTTISTVASPFAAAVLCGYGELTSSRSKYRYGVAALEANCDAAKVRNENEIVYRNSIFSAAGLALRNNDWRKSLTLLFSMRPLLDPKDGLRNEFLQLCVMMHDICRNAGCLSASVVPLRAFSALIYEERLRTLVERDGKRLAMKKRNQFRRYLSGTPIPKLLSGSSMFKSRRNTLASFFEVPIVSAAVDTTLRSSASIISARPRPSTGAMSKASNGNAKTSGFFNFYRFFWPIHCAIFGRKSSTTKTNHNVEDEYTSTHSPEKQPRGSSSSESKHQSGSHVRYEYDTIDTGHTTGDAIATATKSKPPDPGLEQEHRELLRIEAEQEPNADSERSRIELLRIETDYSIGDYRGAERRCIGLLQMCDARDIRCKVLEVMASVRLKRREINRCLESIDLLEREYELLTEGSQHSSEYSHDEGYRSSFFRHHDVEDGRDDDEPIFFPQATYLKLKALTHGGRLDEALNIADKALEVCEESSFWNLGRLHYLRGKILYAMSNNSTPVFRREVEANTGKPMDETEIILKVTELTLEAFETSSHYFDAASDELSAAKSDLKWARTCIDFLFRRVVLSAENGGGIPLNLACKVLDRVISISEVQQVIYNILNVFKNANIPLLIIDAMGALAEVKCIRGHSSSSWGFWVLEGWKLFARLFTNSDDLSVVISSMAPVSMLMRIRQLCGRLVRLVMCNESEVHLRDMNKHLRLFEVYVQLQLTIDQKMNLASSAHRNSDDSSALEENPQENEEERREEQGGVSSRGSQRISPRDTLNQQLTNGKSVLGLSLMKSSKSYEKKSDRKTDRGSDTVSETPTIIHNKRPDGAFLHMLGNEGVALGKQGVSMFINRPRKHVISAVKETGAVLIPTNFFSNSRSPPESHELGKDAELIFPLAPNLGLGAMQILNDNNESEIQSKQYKPSTAALNGQPKHNSGMQSDVRFTSFSIQTTVTHEDGIPIVNEIEPFYPPTPNTSRPSERHNPSVFNSMHSNLQSNSNVFGDQEKKQLSYIKSAPLNQQQQNNVPKNRNELAYLVQLITEESQRGTIKTNGGSSIFGDSIASKVWAHMHRVKAESKRYMHGEIKINQLQERNREAVLSWMHCIPSFRQELNIPESTRRKLVYILYAHGIVGYYAIDRGGCISRVAFGGKLGKLKENEFNTNNYNQYNSNDVNNNNSNHNYNSNITFNKNNLYFENDRTSTNVNHSLEVSLAKHPTRIPSSNVDISNHDNLRIRSPNNLERQYLSEMVRGFKSEKIWYKRRDREIINGLSTQVLKTPRIVLNSTAPGQKLRNRPITLIVDSALQTIPWELFFDHVVIRSHRLLDIINCIQEENEVKKDEENITSTATLITPQPKRIVQFLNFIPSGKEVVDLERTEETRRQQLAFQGLLRLNQLHATSLISFLDLGGFSDPTAVNAVARPTGPLSSPLTQSRKGVQVFGKRIVGNIGKRNFPHLEFIKVTGLSSASTQDLKEAVMAMNTVASQQAIPNTNGNGATTNANNGGSSSSVNQLKSSTTINSGMKYEEKVNDSYLKNSNINNLTPNKNIMEIKNGDGNIIINNNNNNSVNFINNNAVGRFGAFISVFLFSYADLIDGSESVFGLRREIGNSILIFVPAVHMKVVARHLEDEELSEEIVKVCGIWPSPLFPDIPAVARVVIESVSRFSREKRIPIVVFPGEKLMNVYPNNRRNANITNERKPPSAVDRMAQLSGVHQKKLS